MAATTVQGTGGAVTTPTGFNAKFLSFTATLEVEEMDTTGFGDNGWVNGEIIGAKVTGTAIGVLSTLIPVPALVLPTPAGIFGAASMEGTIKLTFQAATALLPTQDRSWEFSALITAIEVGRAEEGAGSSTYRITFESSGPVTQVWQSAA